MNLLPAICAGFAGLAMLSGIAIACRYVPAPEHAHAALLWLTTDIPAGQFIYSLHIWSTSLLIGALHLLLFRDLLTRRYQSPRRCAWLTGLACYALAMALGFTGSLLPWTQHAYWDAVVRIGLMDATPIIGPQLATLVRGGDYIGLLTLVTYYAVHSHILGPLLALGLWRRLSLDAQLPDQTPERLPHFAALFAIGATCLLAIAIPAVLGDVADPASTGYEARPEWWFLPLFQLRKLVSGPEEIPVMILIIGLVSILLIAAPWLDPAATDRRRGLIMRIVAGLGIAAWLALLITGAMDRPREAKQIEKPAAGKIEAIAATEESPSQEH